MALRPFGAFKCEIEEVGSEIFFLNEILTYLLLFLFNSYSLDRPTTFTQTKVEEFIISMTILDVIKIRSGVKMTKVNISCPVVFTGLTADRVQKQEKESQYR